MKLIIEVENLKENPEQILRQAGYTFIIDRQRGQESFVRRLGGNFYPRFHVYIERRDSKAVFNLHLDQKEASYPGAHAHNADYEGEAVEREIERLKSFVTIETKQINVEDSKLKENKEGWFGKLFGN